MLPLIARDEEKIHPPFCRSCPAASWYPTRSRRNYSIRTRPRKSS
jgi:hypothetical protein